MLIYQVASTDEAHAEDVNQITRALRNVLGIQADDQDAVGKWVLPSSAAAPGSPAEAMRYYNSTDLIQYLRNGSSQWVPERPLRQVDLDATFRTEPLLEEPSVTFAGDGKMDVQAEREITLTGSGVLVLVTSRMNGLGLVAGIDTNNEPGFIRGRITVQLKRGSAIIFQADYTLITHVDTAGGIFVFATAHNQLMLYDEPGPGTYRYTLNRKLTWDTNSSAPKYALEDAFWLGPGPGGETPRGLQFLEV